MILGIDSSIGTAVACIAADGSIRADRYSPNPLGHAEVIGSMIAEVVAEHQIEAVAVGMGPGPFTGLRVGIAAARVFAIGRSVPVIPVPSHDAAALTVLTKDTVGGRELATFAIVTDARRREFAYTLYQGIDENGLPIRVQQPALIPQMECDTKLNALEALRVDATEISAAMIALCALRAQQANRVLTGSEPLYLRSPDVSVRPVT